MVKLTEPSPPKGRRICLVTFFYRPSGGGVQRYVEEIAKRFAELGNKVDILTMSPNGKKIEQEENITIYRLPSMNVFLKKEENDKKASNFLKFLRKYVKEKRPDIIVGQNTQTIVDSIGHSIALNVVSMERNIPIALTVHAFIRDDEFKPLRKTLIKNFHWNKIIAVSSNLAESLFKENIPSEKIVVSYPPVDTGVFKPHPEKKWLRSRIGVSENEKLIVHASRLDNMQVAEEKGVFTLLKAIPNIKEENIKVLIATAPTGSLFQKTKDETINKVKETAKLLGIENKIIIGTFAPEDMPLVYNGADLFVMASQRESFGLVYAEALSCEIPVIGTTVGGIPEAVQNGQSGELVPPDNPIELAKSISSLLQSPKKMKKFGEYGRQHVLEKQNLTKITKNLLGIYESVIVGKKKRNFTPAKPQKQIKQNPQTTLSQISTQSLNKTAPLI